MANAGGEEWEILLTAEVETFLDHLYESDPASHQLVNQAIVTRGGRRSCWWPGTSQGSGTSGTGPPFPAQSSCTTITWPSAGRRWGHERRITLARVRAPGAGR